MEKLKALGTKRGFKTVILFAIVFTFLILVDQLSKGSVFNGDESGATGDTKADGKVIAFRSQFHKSTTFLDFLNVSMPLGASLLIDYVLIILFIAILIFNKNIFMTIATSIALTGIIGNTIDQTFFHGERNCLFIPGADHGTFNFADFYIVLGAPLLGLSFMYYLGKDNSAKPKKEKKVKETKPSKTTKAKPAE